MDPPRPGRRRCWPASSPSRWASTPASSRRLSLASTTGLEQGLLDKFGKAGAGRVDGHVGGAQHDDVGKSLGGRRTGCRVEGALPPLDGAVEWLNSPPLTPQGLRGKVVLVDFWTYSCINCLRAMPYVQAWAEKYKDQGLVVIGVHAPEFAFETNARQRQAARCAI